MKRPPGPGTFRLLARLARARGDTPGVLEAIARKHGGLAYLRAGPTGAYLLSHPDLVRQVLETHEERFARIPGERRVSTRLLDGALFAAEGEMHANQRALMEPLMYRDAPPFHAPSVVDFAERMTEGWQDKAALDALGHLERMAAGVVVKVLFGEDTSGANGAAVAVALARASRDLNRITLGATALADRFPVPGRRRFRRSLAELHSVLDSLAGERAGVGSARPDVLSMMLRASGEEGRGMSTEMARDQAVGLYRGHQGVGAAIAWTWMLLAQNPEAERRFHQEIDSVLGDRSPRYEDLPALPFTMGAFREAIRLYPTAWILARQALSDHPAAGRVVPAGSTVLVSPWIVHRDPRVWDEPERFDPDRFSPERTAARPAGSYFPLGMGSKRCMGMELLPMEAVMVLATVGRKWRLKLSPGQRVVPSPKVTLKPKGGLPVTLERRG